MVFRFGCSNAFTVGQRACARQTALASELAYIYAAKTTRGRVAPGRSIAPDTYNWGTKRLYIDVLGEWYFYKRWGVFANLRNIGDAAEDFEVYNALTPEHAQWRQREDFGALWTFGLKTTF